MNCRCKSYNRPRPEQDVPPVELSMPDALIERSGFSRKPKAIDACIADAIAALWAADVLTGGSCCGHNGVFGDPRPNVAIAPDEDPKKALEVLRSVDSREWRVLQHGLVEHVYDPHQEAIRAWAKMAGEKQRLESTVVLCQCMGNSAYCWRYFQGGLVAWDLSKRDTKHAPEIAKFINRVDARAWLATTGLREESES